MSSITLSEKQLRYLRGRAHALKPVLQIGQHGLTDGVCAEAARALHDHELIKVRVQAADRAAREALIAELAGRTASALIQRIGHIAVLFKARRPLSRIPLPES
jgi:RNA-binding protein